MRNWLLLYASSGNSLSPDLVHQVCPDAASIAPGLYAVQESLAGVPAPVARHGPYALVGDVRLDNREDVRGALTASPDASDEVLVMQGFERWGDACLDRCVGVWTFSIWDSKDHKLWLARDPIGIRQFYYAWRGSVLACSSTIDALFPLWPNGRPPANVSWVREFAEWKRGRRVIEETVWDGIRCLPPGHAWRPGAGGERPQRYWYFGRERQPRYQRDEERAEHLRDLLQEAVRCRLDQDAPTAIAVSGGIDSTVMLAAADAAVDSGCQAQLRLYNLAFAGDERADESRYVSDVGRYYRYPLTRVNGHTALDFRTLGTGEDLPRNQPFVHLGVSAWASVLRQAAADRCESILTGEGGDEVMGRYVYLGGRFLRDWPVWCWPRELLAAVGSSGRPFWRLLAGAVATDGVGQLLGRPSADLPIQRVSRITWAGRRALQVLTSGQMCYLLSQQTESALLTGLELRYPFLDVRLVNYMISLPARQHGQRGVTRWLMRKSAAGRVPESVRTRQRGGIVSQVIARRAVGADAQFLEDLLKTPGLEYFVDIDAALDAWRSLRDMPDPTDVFSRRLAPALSIAAWMRRTRNGVEPVASAISTVIV